MDKIRKRTQNRIKWLHRDIINHIFHRLKSDLIVLPYFKPSSFIPKRDRALRKSTIKNLLQLSHGTLREKIIRTAKRLGRKVVLVGEAFTSKVCSSCFQINSRLGGSRTFKCPHDTCAYHHAPVSRDAQSTLNILYRNLQHLNLEVDISEPSADTETSEIVPWIGQSYSRSTYDGKTGDLLRLSEYDSSTREEKLKHLRTSYSC